MLELSSLPAEDFNFRALLCRGHDGRVDLKKNLTSRTGTFSYTVSMTTRCELSDGAINDGIGVFISS
jgi:hypothetical protein